MVDYKLRLGDGTTFSVDEKGLTTWLQGGLVDDKARVQPTGSKKWFTLKQVLAAQGTQRGHAVRQTEEGRADVDRQAAAEAAEIERKVAEQRAAEERKATEDLAAAERKAAADRNAAERKLIQDREEAQRRAAAERAAAEARAAAEIQTEKERLETEKRAAAERAVAERQAAEERAEAERREAAAREAERVAEAERLVAAERAERAEKKRKAEEARIEAEQRAAEDARLATERKAAEEHAAERKKAEAEKRVAAEREERAERKRRAEEETRAEQRAADERLAAERRAADERLAARAAEERAARDREAAMQALNASASPGPPETEIAIEPAATMVKVEDFERELGLVPVMFNDGSDRATGRESGGRTDRGARVPSRDRSESAASLREDAATGVVKPPTAVDTVVMRLLKVLDRAVIWVVRTLAPLVGAAVARSARSLKSAGPKLQAVFARRASPAEPAPAADRPSIAPVAERPLAAPMPARPAERPAPVPAPAPAPAPWAAPPPPPSPAAVKASAPVKTSGAAPPRQPAVPPPSFQKMDVIPFAAAAAQPNVDNDVWDGDDPWQEPSGLSATFSVLWLWVKRATIATALIVTVAVLALNKQKWLPQAKDAATVLGQNVDKLQESTRTVSPEAIDAARAQIPYLRPQTIELIMAKSAGVLEPAEVFRRAHQAAESARPSLPTHVAAEIDNLTAAVAAELEPAEGEQLRTYLAAMRAGTPTAAYQDKEAVWLMGRGVRRLSAERIARMEELFAQAVAVALQPPPA